MLIQNPVLPWNVLRGQVGQPHCDLVSHLQPHGIITRGWKAFYVGLTHTQDVLKHMKQRLLLTVCMASTVNGPVLNSDKHSPCYYEFHGLCMLI